MTLPVHILSLLNTLENAGFEAWAVGGCVRDALLKLRPKDYDLCTNALPEQIKALFPARQLVLAGEKHGTVGVVTEAGVVEITTFRTEGDYGDSRHPGWVRFVPTLQEDLARRDFTVNAMAYSPKGGLQDPFGGKKDLKKRVLRCVGEPRERFREDALRILRGVRFCVTYRLTPDFATLQAMLDLAYTLPKLSRERVFSELCKLIPGLTAEHILDFAPILSHAVGEFANYGAAVTLPQELTVRLGVLLSGADARKAMEELRASAALRDRVAYLARESTVLVTDLPRQVALHGREATGQLLTVQKAMLPQYRRPQRQLEQLANMPDVTLKSLRIGGDDLKKLGFPADKSLGKGLEELLTQVLAGAVANEKQALTEAAKKLLEQM